MVAAVAAATALAAISACGTIELDGGDWIKVAIPRASESHGGFADDFTVSFESFVLTANGQSFDLVRNGPHRLRDRPTKLRREALAVAGTAVQTRFIYAFRWTFTHTATCTITTSGPLVPRPEQLFLITEDRRPRFEPLVRADNNRDAIISMEELGPLQAKLEDNARNLPIEGCERK